MESKNLTDFISPYAYITLSVAKEKALTKYKRSSTARITY